MRFTAVMTVICIERLGLSEEYVPQGVLSEIETLDRPTIERFEEDMYKMDYVGFSSNSLKDRIKRGIEFYRKRWKIKEYLGVSATAFLWEKVKAINSFN